MSSRREEPGGSGFSTGEGESMRRFIVAAIVVAGLTGIIAGPASAAKGSGSTSSSSTLSLVVLNSSDGLPHWNGQVTFNVSTTATDQPFVQLDCYQGTAHVYWASAGFFDSYPWQWARDFTLRSDYWTGGAASCTAKLYYVTSNGRSRTLATLGFDVAA